MAKEKEQSEVVIEKAKDFWARSGKKIIGVGLVLLLAVGGFWAYKNLYQKPKEAKAADAIFEAEKYFRKDSVQLALNGDGQNAGFLKIIDKFSGTKTANLAKFYAGACYIKLDDNTKAIKYLKDFSTDSKLIQARAYKLLGDAYADSGKPQDALDYYKKAARHFEQDTENSSDALFLAAYLSDRVLKNSKEAVSLYTELKEKFPNTQRGYEADNYLAQLGTYNVD